MEAYMKLSDPIYSIQETAQRFGVSADTIRRYDNQGVVSLRRICGRRVLTDSDLRTIEAHRKRIRTAALDIE